MSSMCEKRLTAWSTLQRFLKFYVVPFIFVFSGMSFAAKPVHTQHLAEVIDQTVTDYVKGMPYAGIGITIWHQDRLLIEKGYGFAHLAQGTPFTRETVLSLGPNSTLLTAMAIMQLVEQKQINLTDPLARFVSTNNKLINQLTIQQLMCHCTGIVDFTGGTLDDVEYEKSPSVRALLNTFTRRALRFTPGSKAQYSASNYVLLSLVIEQVSGMRLGDYLREYLFVPYGLKNTYYLADSFYIPHLAQSYSSEENIIQPFVLPLEYRLLMGAGAVASNLSDYVRWHSMMMKGYMVSEASLAFLTSPCVLNNGKTADIAPAVQEVTWYPEHKMYYFGGELNGYMANTMYFPDYELSIGIGTNKPDNVKFIFDQLVSHLLK